MDMQERDSRPTTTKSHFFQIYHDAWMILTLGGRMLDKENWFITCALTVGAIKYVKFSFLILPYFLNSYQPNEFVY